MPTVSCQHYESKGAADGTGEVSSPLLTPRSRLRELRVTLVASLQAIDLRIVYQVSRVAQTPSLQMTAINITRLGNFWIYPLLLAVSAPILGAPCVEIFIAASITATLLHIICYGLKRYFSRRRPFQVVPELAHTTETLDAHSFPSGHTMTMAGVMTPTVIVWPMAVLPALILIISMAWSRVATGHHYPSDVLAGAIIGIVVGYPVTIGVAHFW